MEEERVVQTSHVTSSINRLSTKSALYVVCAFGWGQIFRLYHDRLYARGRYYALKELTHVDIVYHHVLGIPSARLELRFASKLLVLRGIAAIAEAQKAADYLQNWCAGSEPVTDYSAAISPAPSITLALPTSSQDRQERQAVALTMDVSTIPTTRRQRKARHSVDEQYEYGIPPRATGGYVDVDRLEMIKTNISLPIVRVPIRLLAGEHAHYSTSATRCGERSGSEQNPRGSYAGYYPALDHGMLILTNRRMMYIGRNNQIVLDYSHLLHFSRLRTAVAFQADHWQKRVIFAVPQPIECSLYMEAILHRLQQSVSYSQEQTL
jgi:hypothetical protein